MQIQATNAINRTRTTFETPKYPRRPRDQYTAQIVNTLELSGPHQIELKKKTPLQPGEVSNNKYMYICSSKNVRTVKQSHCETVYGLVKLAQYLCNVTGSPTVNGGQVCHQSGHLWLFSVLIPLVCHVHLHQYSWFGRIFSAVANRYRTSASLLKRSVSIISIS